MEQLQAIFDRLFPKKEPEPVQKPKPRTKFDRLLLTAEGAAGVSHGINMVVAPIKTQDNLLESSSDRSNAMTRLAGSGAIVASSYTLMAGMDNDPKAHRRAARLTALHSAMGTGFALAQLRSTAEKRVAQEDKMRTIAIAGAINTAICLARGFRKLEE